MITANQNRPAGQTGWLAGIKIVNEIRVQCDKTHIDLFKDFFLTCSIRNCNYSSINLQVKCGCSSLNPSMPSPLRQPSFNAPWADHIGHGSHNLVTMWQKSSLGHSKGKKSAGIPSPILLGLILISHICI